jgi:ABC-type Na+ efflux pump permease subunit
MGNKTSPSLLFSPMKAGIHLLFLIYILLAFFLYAAMSAGLSAIRP